MRESISPIDDRTVSQTDRQTTLDANELTLDKPDWL